MGTAKRRAWFGTRSGLPGHPRRDRRLEQMAETLDNALAGLDLCAAVSGRLIVTGIGKAVMLPARSLLDPGRPVPRRSSSMPPRPATATSA